MRGQGILPGWWRSVVIVDEGTGQGQHVVFDMVEQRGCHAGVAEEEVGRSHPRILPALRCTIVLYVRVLETFQSSLSMPPVEMARRLNRSAVYAFYPSGIASRHFRN